MNKEIVLKKLIYVLIIVSFLSSEKIFAAVSQEKRKIAILKFSANNITPSIADGVRDMLEVNLYNTNSFDILERNQVDLILKEQGFVNKYCSEEECAVKIGKILSADKVIVGSVNRIGGYTITLKYVDIERGQVEYADSEKVDTEEAISDATRSLAEKAADRIMKIRYKMVTPAGYYLRAIAPGWGQIYSGRYGKGIAFLGAFAAAGAYTVYAVYDFKEKRKEYDSLKSGSRSEFESKYDRSNDAFKRANIALCVTAAIYAAGWVDALFFTKPQFGVNVKTGSNDKGYKPFIFNLYTSAPSGIPESRFESGYRIFF